MNTTLYSSFSFKTTNVMILLSRNYFCISTTIQHMMTSFYATSLAIFFHFILKISIFIDPGPLSHSNSTNFESIPSYLNLLSVLLLTNEYQLLPQRYIHRISTLFYVLVETILLLIIIEFSMIFVWSQMETYIEAELKNICILNPIKKCFAVERICVTCFMILLSFGFFLVVAMTVNLYGSLQKQVSIIFTSITNFFDSSID